ncbi:MAG: hypothetical protein R6T90_08055 [Dissulfuribacterales bacterium]
MYETIKYDLMSFYKYHFITIIIVISLFFSLSMGITNLFPPVIYIYISVFIMPVITFSVSLLIESQQKEVLPKLLEQENKPVYCAIGKIVSATIVQLIPFVFYSIVLFAVLEFKFNIILFFLVYLLSIIMHIIIGLALSIISKS